MIRNKGVYIIAEAGVNHNGAVDMAFKLVDAAVDAGADAVKFQTFKADKLVCRAAPKAEYQSETTGVAETQYEMLKKLELDESAHELLIDYCCRKGVDFLSTPFDSESLDLLTRVFKLSRLKISSGEITNAPLLLEAARTGSSIILSTGMSTLEEVESALGVLAFGYVYPEQVPSRSSFRSAYGSLEGQQALREKVVLLHCTTEYPAPLCSVNLLAMDTLRNVFGLPVGYSDHTSGITAAIAAAARGAVVVEKHFTLDRNLPGPDHRASLEPDELKEMVKSIRRVEETLGSPEKAPLSLELKNMLIARKSLVAASGIEPGEVFTEKNIAIKRPGNGISPFFYWDWLGKVAKRKYLKDDVIVDE